MHLCIIRQRSFHKIVFRARERTRVRVRNLDHN